MSIVATLEGILGKEAVLADDHSRALYAQDVWAQGELPLCVIRPSSVDVLKQAVAAITSAGVAVVPRGGGMSYTKGYTPTRAESVMIDTVNLDRVVEINREDMYVTVEVGCTWKKLYEALKDSGLRTPYWGSLSGNKATVGGSVSQNSIFWGCGQWGSAADSVISMDVVLADGSLLTTGSAARENASPFFRHFGPDLTGIFTADSGALGIKATVTLRLIRDLPARGAASFNFTKESDLIAAMSEISRAGLATECYGFDPNLSSQRARRDLLINDVKAFTGVLKNSRSIFAAIRDGIKIAFAGRRFMNNFQWPMHTSVEERCDAAVQVSLAEIRAIVRKHNGEELENSIPTILRSNPFPGVNNMIGPGGERWVPVHCLIPHSKAQEAFNKVQAIYDRHIDGIKQFNITPGYLFNTVATNSFVIEPVFFWPDSLHLLHKESLDKAYLEKIQKHEDQAEARQLVASMRQEMVDLFRELGAVHLQIGKVYPYASSLKPEALHLVKHIKQAVDPKGLINPGALELN